MASLIFSSDDWVKLPGEKTDEVYYWKPWTGEICEKRDTHSIGACKDSSNQWYFWRLGSQETFWLLTSSASSSKDTGFQQRTVVAENVSHNDFCFDVFKNQVLKDMANQKKLPNVAEMNREDLLESLRLVSQWEAMDLEALQHVAEITEIPMKAIAVREDIIEALIDVMFGWRRLTSFKISTSHAVTTPCALQELPQGKLCCHAQSNPQSLNQLELQSQPIYLDSTFCLSADVPSSFPFTCKLPSHERLAFEVERILASVAKGSVCNWQAVLGFSCGEVLSLESVCSKFQQLMLVLHPDKRSEESIAKVGNIESIETAFLHVMNAYSLACKEVPSKALDIANNFPAPKPKAVPKRFDIANNFPAPKPKAVPKRWPSASAMQSNKRLVRGTAGLRPHEIFPGGSLGLLAPRN